MKLNFLYYLFTIIMELAQHSAYSLSVCFNDGCRRFVEVNFRMLKKYGYHCRVFGSWSTTVISEFEELNFFVI